MLSSTTQHFKIDQKRVDPIKTSQAKAYRERVYIIKDIISTLGSYNGLNQTALFSYCGLNLTKHGRIITELESNKMIVRLESDLGKRKTIVYKITHDGLEFYRSILEPFEKMFPRRRSSWGA